MMEDKLARAKGRMHTDHAFYAGATHDNTDLLPIMERMPGVCGVKVFMGASTGQLLVEDDEGVEAVPAREEVAIGRREGAPRDELERQ